LYFQRRELIYKATVCSSSVGLALESNCFCHCYAGGTNNVQRVAFQINPYTGGTNICFLKPSLCWRYKQLLSKSIPYVCGTSLHLRYKPTLAVQTVAFWINLYAGGTDAAGTGAADPYSRQRRLKRKTSVLHSFKAKTQNYSM